MRLLHPTLLHHRKALPNYQDLANHRYQKLVRHLSVTLWMLFLNGSAIAQIYQEHAMPTLFPVGHSATAWADYNNDGYLDFIITGQKSNGEHATELFRNNGDDTFTFYTAFTPIAYGSVIWGDVNNDNYLDFHLTGETSAGYVISELYINQRDETFLLYPASLEGVSQSDATFTDFDHDGDLDLAYTGVSSKGKSVCKFYKNQRGTFIEVLTPLPGFSHGSLEAADYNHDGYADLLITGLLEDGSKASHIYRNEGNFRFAKLNTTLSAIAFGDASWGDYNQDGYPDVLLSGIGEGGISMSKVYRNNKNGVFTEIAINLDPLSNSSVAWLDYNNDGALDIFISGVKNSNAENALYSNNGDGSFSLVYNTGILKIYDGDISITDHDKDGNLDLLITGFNNMGVQSQLYTNTQTNVNHVPAVPAGLNAVTQEDSVVLSWQPAYDLETASEGLSYEIYVGTLPQETNIIAPHAFTTDGQRKTPKVGSQSYVTTYTLKGLSEGRYYWAVQAIDAGLKASSFSKMDSFDICYAVDLGEDRNICSGETASFMLKKNFDQISWHSAHGIHVENHNAIQFSFYETDTVWVVAKNSLGCILQDTVIVNVHPLPEASLGKDTTICYQEMLDLEVYGAADSINWYSSHAGLLASNISYVSYQALSSDTLWIEIFNANGCVANDTIVINLHDQSEAEAGDDRSICLGNTTVLGKEHNQQNDFVYQWQPAYTLDNAYTLAPVASPDTTTTYVLQVITPDGCTSFDSVTVTVYIPPLLDSVHDTTICIGESVRLGHQIVVHDSLFLPSFEWFPKTSLDNAFVARPLATPDSTTTYTLIVKSGDCRKDSAQVTVHVIDLPDVIVSPDVTIGFGETIQLKAEGGVLYDWFPPNDLSRVDVPDPFVSPKATTTYFITVYNEYGCTSQDSVTVYVDNRVFIPNLFSPNQDGQNDSFKVYGSGIEVLTLQIYDALGKQVYKSTDIQEIMETGWDGTFHGSPLASGHYLWAIQGKFYDGKAVMFQGKTSGKIRLIR